MITRDDIAAHLDSLAKPPGSLGRLEALALRLALVQGTLSPKTEPRKLVVFAGDHGVVGAGVGIWPSAVTSAMIDCITAGKACCSALATATATPVELIDAGSLRRGRHPGGCYEDRRIGEGTNNLAEGPAMTAQDFAAAIRLGAETVERARMAGCRVLAIGEIGIGNTTPAACLIALLTGSDPDTMVGTGAGATVKTLEKKRSIVAAAVSRSREVLADDPVRAMASVAGYEIAAMAGAITAAARTGMTVILDGVVTAAAALVAQRIDPNATRTAIAAHLGAEPAHAIALEHLGLEPFLEWQLRLGEGTGALLLMPMLDAAAALMTGVAKLEDVAG
ncbi:MAG: nicotinate-nucleotide--dimethylbenzimidazole phosphoribosyltransferase [Hyphomicrobium sp.]